MRSVILVAAVVAVLLTGCETVGPKSATVRAVAVASSHPAAGDLTPAATDSTAQLAASPAAQTETAMQTATAPPAASTTQAPKPPIYHDTQLFGTIPVTLETYRERPFEKRAREVPQALLNALGTDPAAATAQLAIFLTHGIADPFIKMKTIPDWVA